MKLITLCTLPSVYVSFLQSGLMPGVLMWCEIVFYIVTGKMVIAEALVLPSAFCKNLILLSSSLELFCRTVHVMCRFVLLGHICMMHGATCNFGCV